MGEIEGVDENVNAWDTQMQDLIAQPVQMPFHVANLLLVWLADVISVILKYGTEQVFFAYQLEMKEFQLDEEQRAKKMEEWHKTAFTGVHFCTFFSFCFWVSSLIVRAIFPQPRASYVVWIFTQYIIWSHFLRQIAVAIGFYVYLKFAMNSPMCDGSLSYFPDIIDFLHVGVKTADFLSWRMHRILKEEMVMKQVHNGEFARVLKEKLEEASNVPKKREPSRMSKAAKKYDMLQP